MSLADRIAKTKTEAEVRLNLCPAGKLIAGLSDEDGAALSEVLADGIVSISRILQDLRAEGYSIEKGSLSHHRNGTCRCVTPRTT